MKKIMFDDHYGLTQAVLEGRKTMTRRMIPCNTCNSVLPAIHYRNPNTSYDDFAIRKHAHYKVGEEIAIAQRYWDLRKCDAFYEALAKADQTMPLECIKDEKGCCNKMFVKAAWMPHRIRITNIKVERLQDISDEDCLKEGVKKGLCIDDYYVIGIVPKNINDYKHERIITNRDGTHHNFSSPRTAFASLIDRISGKGTWEKNPYVFVYEFELVK